MRHRAALELGVAKTCSFDTADRVILVGSICNVCYDGDHNIEDCLFLVIILRLWWKRCGGRAVVRGLGWEGSAGWQGCLSAVLIGLFSSAASVNCVATEIIILRAVGSQDNGFHLTETK